MKNELFLKNKSALIWGGLALTAILLGGFFYQDEETLFVPAGTVKETPKEAVKSIAKIEKPVEVFLPQKCEMKDYGAPSGKISLSLRESPLGKHTAIYEFDVIKKELTEFLSDSCNNFGLSFSKNGEKITYLSDCQESATQVFVADSNGGNSKQVTKSKPEKEMKARPVFSPDGEKIAFATLPFEGDILAEDGKVYVTDLKGNEEFLTSGTMPIFSPDGKYLLILKNPGLYLFNLETKEAERVLELRDEKQDLITGKRNMMASLSPTGDKLAISNVDREEFYVFGISSWEPFKAQLTAQIKMTGFWNAFSPDGKYLAVQEADIDKMTSASKNPRLSISETCAFSKLSSFSLGDYDPYAMWLASWQK